MCPTYSPDVKIRAVLDYKAGKNSQEKIAKRIGTNWTTLQRLIRQYDSFSKEIFYKHIYLAVKEEHENHGYPIETLCRLGHVSRAA